MSFFQHPDDEHDELILAAARRSAAKQYVYLIENGNPEATLPIEEIEGMPKEVSILQLMTWIGQDEAKILLKACTFLTTGKKDEALHALREFVQSCADEYASNNVF